MTEKPALLLLPGLMCDEAVWEHQAAALSPHAEVIVPVFRGFDSLTAMADYALSLAPERFSVAGHSMGGRVAWELMVLAGNRIDKFAVLDTGVHPVNPAEPGKRQVLIDKAKTEGLAAVAESWIPPMVHPNRHNDAALMGAIRDMILRNTVDDFLGQMHALLHREDRTGILGHIAQEVLLVAGEADGHSPPAQHEAMAALIPRSHLEVIRDAGHMVTMEKPEEVSKILLDWMTQR